MATSVTESDARPTCPICLAEFDVPRQLPCAHSFCQNCLQSYITNKATEYEKMRCIECPICGQTTGHFKENEATIDWASLFPGDTILQSMLPAKSKVDCVCDACNSEGTSVSAIGFCAVCEEAMCANCLNVHRKLKMTKTHSILANEDLQENLQHVIKFAEGFTCIEHNHEDLKFYCNAHKVACCSICFLKGHKICSDVQILKDELPALLLETKTDQIIEELKKLETHFKIFIDINESNMNDLESQVNGLANQIREMRDKLNAALDELEMKVIMEGRRIHEEFVTKTQEENHQCLSQIQAIRNSQLLCETINKYGIDVQKFLISETLKSQLPLYYSKVKEKYERTDILTLHVKLNPLIESVLSLSSSDVGELVTMTGSAFSMPDLKTRLSKEWQVDKVEIFNVIISGGMPWFSDVVILPKNRVMLVDYINNQCFLLKNSNQVIAAYGLKNPYNICVVSDEEVAVSVYNDTKIQILSFRDDVISPVRTITTKYKCMGITSAGNGEIIVVENCGNNKSCFSLIIEGDELKYSDQFDSAYGCRNYIAINNSKTRVYLTVSDKHFLHCFDMDGKLLYTYSPDNLKCPLGVAVDRNDNIYVVGCDSHNIHQLSPKGCNLQVITVGVPQKPMAISFYNCSDRFIITNITERQKLHIYQLK